MLLVSFNKRRAPKKGKGVCLILGAFKIRGRIIKVIGIKKREMRDKF